MPLLYGESDKAFHRLQLQILEQSGDESLFAWWGSNSTLDDIQLQNCVSLFTLSSDFFAGCRNFRYYPYFTRDTISMRHVGLQLSGPLYYLGGPYSRIDFFMPLNCCEKDYPLDDSTLPLGIHLRRSYPNRTFQPVRTNNLCPPVDLFSHTDGWRYRLENWNDHQSLIVIARTLRSIPAEVCDDQRDEISGSYSYSKSRLVKYLP